MNFLFLTQFFSSTRGGGEFVFHHMAKMLAEKNHNVWVISNKIEGENYNFHKNIQVIFVSPTLRYEGGLPPRFSDNLQFSFNAIFKGLKTIQNEKIDVIHSNNFSPALAGSILSTITSVPHVTTIHDVFSLCGKNYWKEWGSQTNISKINVFLAPYFEKLLMKLNYKCIHTVSEMSKEDLVKFGAKKPIYVIPNTIGVIQYSKENQTNNFQFVYVGRLVFYKNVEILLKAVNLVRKNEPNIKLIIVGDGPHRENLEKLVKQLGIESNIDFRGFVNNKEKVDIISKSVALAFPSFCEGFGLVILEAFTQFKPVLVSNVRPMSDIVSHEKNGYVLDPYDEKVWAQYMLDMIKNSDKAKKMGIVGHDLNESHYNENEMFQKLLKMYERVGLSK